MSAGPAGPRRRGGGGGPGPPPGAEEGARVRGRFLSAWNSVRYGWAVRAKPHFSKLSPLHLLGRVYCPAAEEELERFQRDFASRLWLTYRREFPALEGTPWTTDCGWGCMLRSAQMLLAQGLILHLLGRDWTWSEALLEPAAASRRPRDPPGQARDPPGCPRDPPGWTRDPPGYPRDPPGRVRDPPGRIRDPPGRIRAPREAEQRHRAIVAWFADHPRAPFGIHRLVELGRNAGKKAGDCLQGGRRRAGAGRRRTNRAGDRAAPRRRRPGAGAVGGGKPQPRLRGLRQGAAEAEILRRHHRRQTPALPLLRRLSRRLLALPGPPLLPALRGHLPGELPPAVFPLRFPAENGLREDGSQLHHRLLRRRRDGAGGALLRPRPRAGPPLGAAAVPHLHAGGGSGAGPRLGAARLPAPPAAAAATSPRRQAPQKTQRRRVRLPLTPPPHPGTPPKHWIRPPGWWRRGLGGPRAPPAQG
ncbi:cysteine protease ATG4D isoform X2 [Calonectris borealis]|uniref:cysteine protease ATG4D isoform X2 n=1 Tax=Calonectris borealis TaxID=1323832 RepID=UPI003F4B0085